MQVIETHLQSKFSEVPDHGGEDRLVANEHFAAVIDSVTAKTASMYPWEGYKYTSGLMAANILSKAVHELDPDMTAEEVCLFLNNKIRDAYAQFGVLDWVKSSPIERFTAMMAIYHAKARKVILAGECQTVIGPHYHRVVKKVDTINSIARANEIQRLIDAGQLTEEALLSMDMRDDPGRKLIMNPPAGSQFPGLKDQIRHQNDRFSLYGYFALDGFADLKAPGFEIYDVPDYAEHVVLATDGYLFPDHIDPVDALCTLENAEKNLQFMLRNDPCCFKLYKSTKGKGTDPNYDDRAYIRVKT